jgi:hypothetical protein
MSVLRLNTCTYSSQEKLPFVSSPPIYHISLNKHTKQKSEYPYRSKMVLITTSTEIACSPAHLRKIVRLPPDYHRHTDNPAYLTIKPKQFLDFPRIPQWTQGFIRSISPQTPNKPATSLAAGDKLNVQLEGMSFAPVVLVSRPTTNSPNTHAIVCSH